MGTATRTTPTNIRGLIPDIYQLLEESDGIFPQEAVGAFATEVSLRLQSHYGQDSHRPTLRLSQMGPRCPRALWFSIHHPELAEPLPPWAKIKYSYGHILECQTISLAKAAGHEVTGEQDELVVDGVVGHRDCVIDGCLVDVKSTTSFGFQKFKDGSIALDDTFGYLDQLDGYLVGSLHDDLVRTKDRAYLLAVDKQLGHMCLYEHRIREDHIRKRIEDAKSIVGASHPPSCTCGTVADGKSGNVKLDVKASYSAYKHICFPSLRIFKYASGPVFLTHVARKPDVMEIDKHGQTVYH